MWMEDELMVNTTGKSTSNYFLFYDFSEDK